MNKKDVKRLKDIGVSILDVKYTYPDEKWMEEYGFWNYEQWDDEIVFHINGRVESPKHARQIEEALLILVKAKQSDDPRILDMLEQLETLIGLIEDKPEQEDK